MSTHTRSIEPQRLSPCGCSVLLVAARGNLLGDWKEYPAWRPV